MSQTNEAVLFSTRWTLLKKVKNLNDHEAWNQFHKIYSAYIEKLMRGKHATPEQTDDIVAIVMAELAKIVPEFIYNPARGRFRSLIKTIASRRFIDGLRKGANDRANLSQSASASGEVGTSLIDGQPDLSIPTLRERAAQDFAIAVVRRAMQLLRDPAYKIGEKHLLIFDDYVISELVAQKVADNHNVPVDQVYLAKTRLMPKFKEACIQATKELAPEESD